MGSEDLLDTSRLCYDGDFDTQFRNILHTVRLTRRQVENTTYLTNDLRAQLRHLWPGCNVHAFGSIVIGLGIKSSDVDCYVETHSSEPPRDCVMQARNILKNCPHLFRKIFAITAAKVPIVKLYHAPTYFNCDISFSGFAGVRNSEFLAHILHLDERAIKLAIFIKYWSKVCDFTGTNLMPNYALTLLVVFYLQHKGILPSVLSLQRGAPRMMIDGWNTGFNEQENTKPRGCNDTMYELLGGFFKYYSTFDYTEDMISPYVGYRLKRKAFSCIRNVPNDFELYKQNLGARACKPLRVDTFMCIQDTFEHNRNCTVAVYPRLAVKIVAHFKYAAELYEKGDSQNFLRKLLTEDPNAEARTPSIPNNNQRGRITKQIKNNKQLFKKNIKDLFKAGQLTVNYFPKRKR